VKPKFTLKNMKKRKKYTLLGGGVSYFNWGDLYSPRGGVKISLGTALSVSNSKNGQGYYDETN